ncbi:MAG: RNA pseudouridine synthase [Pirellulales bacterium]
MIDVLYQAGALLIVAKPGGVLTQAPPGIDSMELRVKRWLADQRGRESIDDVYLGVPHRLDRPVSGALVLSTRAKATRLLGEQFEDRVVRKTYWAWVSGQVTPTAGRWIDSMRKVPDQPRAELVPPDSPGAKQAILCYQVHRTSPTGSLLEIGLETGRMHQIRLQLATHGHPVWGDELYGSSEVFGPEVADAREKWIALHARQVVLRHPETGVAVVANAPFPAWWDPVCPGLNG